MQTLRAYRSFGRTPTEVETDSKTIAKSLTGWKLDRKSITCWSADLTNSKDQTITINYDLAPRQYQICFHWPECSRRMSHAIKDVSNSIRCNYQRGPEAAAAAIKKRLIPVLDTSWEPAQALANKADEDHQRLRATTQHLSKLFGRQGGHDTQLIYGNWGFYKLSISGDGRTVTRAILDNLPIELIEKLVQVCKDHFTKD